MRFYAYLPSDGHLSTTEVEAFVAILGPHVDNVDKVFVKTGTHKDADAIRVGFFFDTFPTSSDIRFADYTLRSYTQYKYFLRPFSLVPLAVESTQLTASLYDILQHCMAN